MDRIVIEVADRTAQQWRFKDPQTRQHISRQVDKILQTILEASDDDLWPLLEKIRDEAEKKGFNDQILNQILNAD